MQFSHKMVSPKTDQPNDDFGDIAPKAPVHILLIPKKHLASLAEAGPDDAALLSFLTKWFPPKPTNQTTILGY